MRLSHILASVGALSWGARGEGINCHGSSNCGNAGFKLSGLRATLQGIDDGRTYYNGQHIACWQDRAGSGFCAFLQGTGGILGRDVKRLAQELVNHGCAKCGSVPVFFPQDNDVRSHGILTVNYVSSTRGCNGRC